MEGSPKEKSTRPRSRQSLAHVSSKANTTTDIAALRRNADAKAKSKRVRGKSIGPGGLEALTETDANALKIPPAFQPRSILKPSIPLTPPKVIPSFDELRKRSTTKLKSPAKSVPEELLIDFSTPGPNRTSSSNDMDNVAFSLVDPFSPVANSGSSRSPEADPHADDGEEQRRQAEKKAALEHRAARRKSLANRRVSFAPEATLHTWSVMEMLEDSTTSSAANSTRRQSAMTAATPSTRIPGTPAKGLRPDAVDGAIHDTPDSHGELHHRNCRRTSDMASAGDGDESFSSPGDDAESSPLRVEESIDSESDTDGDTAMSLDDATETSVRSSASSSTQNSLDERLRQAANLAGTRGIGYDESGLDEDDQPMEIADGTVTHAFRQYSGAREDDSDVSDRNEDKENINVFRDDPEADMHEVDDNTAMDQTMGMTMEMTRAVGGILSQKLAPGRIVRERTSLVSDPSDETGYGDETMELTVAKGGILSNLSHDHTSHSDETMDFTVAKGGILPNPMHDDTESDEDLTMEMTNVVGGLRSTNRDLTQSFTSDETDSMDMTVAGGGILPAIQEQTEPQSFVDEGLTMAMDITNAVERIVQTAQSEARYPDLPPLQQNEADTQNVTKPATWGTPVDRASASMQMAPSASETGSPSLKPRRFSRRSLSNSNVSTPRSSSKALMSQPDTQNDPRSSKKASTPQEAGQGTPTRQMTPAPLRGTSPVRTPILTANVMTRGASPKKLFQQEIQQRASPAARKSPRRQQDLLFAKDETTGLHTPRVVLHAPKPHQHLRRKSSGIGVDKVASTSPRVSEVLSRRASLTETIPSFQLQLDSKKKSPETDPQQLHQQIDAERIEEHRRESGRFVMEQEANEPQEEDTTHNLRGMIESMTPKKERSVSKMKSRKSLAVGSAKGLLGKRPAELDDDEDEEATPKRLRTMSQDGSPIKSIRLPKGPTIEQTTGRLSKTAQKRLDALAQQTTTPVGTPSSSRKAESPETAGKFKHSTPQHKPVSFETRLDNVVGASDVATTHPETVKDAQEEPMSLQQFLNMTNVHFIELSTAKRRQTIAPTDSNVGADDAAYNTEAAFVAAASSLPQLDLYQHATRELNSYISSGRKDIRQIEAEMLNEQPPIFKAYLDASADIRAVMDNQFRNVKTRARLQSKESWYAWRSQLVDGLQSGLEGINTELMQDNLTLSQQQAAIDQVLPYLVAKKPDLEEQLQGLRQRYEELSEIDQATLESRRSELLHLDLEVSQRAQRLSELRQRLQEKDEVLTQVSELRTEMTDQITEAKRVQDEQSRWHKQEVTSFKADVEGIETETGWKVLSAETPVEEADHLGTALKLEYKGMLHLTFHPSSFQAESRNQRRASRKSGSDSRVIGPIKLNHISSDLEGNAMPEPAVELKFILRCIQSQLNSLSGMVKGSVSTQSLLAIVTDGWSLGEKISSEIASLGKLGIVHVTASGEDGLCTQLMLMQSDRGRIDIDFLLKVCTAAHGSFSTSSNIRPKSIYGKAIAVLDAAKIRKVQAALSKETESRPLGSASWINAVQGFQQWLQVQVQAKVEMKKPIVTTTAKSATAIDSKQSDETDTKQKQRAVTASPQRNGTPKRPTRSPLAPRTTNSKIQRKALPVPKKSLQPESQIPIASSQKENVIMGMSKHSQDVKVVNEKMAYDDVFGVTKAAIPPEVQEAMMHTPVKKRVGALRRSPY